MYLQAECLKLLQYMLTCTRIHGLLIISIPRIHLTVHSKDVIIKCHKPLVAKAFVIHVDVKMKVIIGASLSEPHVVCTMRKFLPVCLSAL